MRTLFFLLFPAIAISQDFSFDNTWEGTYFCPSDAGRITLEIFYPQNHNEYSCSIKTKTDTLRVRCFLFENKLAVTDHEGMLFMLCPYGNIINTLWCNQNQKYYFYPEPEIECYYEPEKQQ